MNYFFLIYQVIIAEKVIELVKVGRVVSDFDYTPNLNRYKITDVYIKKHSSKNMAVKLHDKKKVTSDEFETEANSFYITSLEK